METTPSILLIAKEGGVTSFRALAAVKRLLGKRVGHAGTLDKFAQGLLVVLTGSMTRLNPLFMNLDKRYTAMIRFGSETDTLDPEGEVVRSAPVPTFEEIEGALPQFIGAIEQAPPLYSAVHIDGRRASDRARDGQTPVMKKRSVTVHRFDLLTYEDGLLTCDITVSKGTYIRSLARDLGRATGSGAHLEELVRTEIGPFLLAEAHRSIDIESLDPSLERSEEYLLRLPAMNRMTCSHDELSRMVHGQFPRSALALGRTGWALAYDGDGVLQAVLDLANRKIAAWLRPYIREEGGYETL
ncbi:MAG: tRNA pseudouridine(55) synthase TruB [Sphaerochaeta sp.]|jgi:tRNA pseudouridine55 synthase|nr:tRNA pseudouridine(55) synthase TruB [Sphaerochaeta sp.]